MVPPVAWLVPLLLGLNTTVSAEEAAGRQIERLNRRFEEWADPRIGVPIAHPPDPPPSAFGPLRQLSFGTVLAACRRCTLLHEQT